MTIGIRFNYRVHVSDSSFVTDTGDQVRTIFRKCLHVSSHALFHFSFTFQGNISAVEHQASDGRVSKHVTSNSLEPNPLIILKLVSELKISDSIRLRKKRIKR